MTEITTPELVKNAEDSAVSSRDLCVHFAAVLVVSTSAAALFADAAAAVSTALGLGLSAANALVMRRIMRALAGAGGAAAAWGLVLPIKLVAVIGVAYVLVERGVANPVPLAIGFALLPLTCVFLPAVAQQNAAALARAAVGSRPRARRQSVR